MDAQLATYAPSNNAIVSGALAGLESQFERAAEANVRSALEASGAAGDYTTMEIRAMKVVEELKLINGMDLAAILMRGKLLKQIEEESLWTVHPSRYSDLKTMAKEQGISYSELHNVKDMCFVIFPYMTEVLEMDVATTFENIGKSGMRELVPVLKALITGETPDHDSVRAAVEHQLDDVVATERAAGREINDQDAREQAIRNLIRVGETSNVRTIREHVRPQRTPPISPAIIDRGENKIVVCEMNADQYLAFQRKLDTFLQDPYLVDASHRRIRRSEANLVPALREFMESIE